MSAPSLGWLVEALAASTLLMGLVLLVRKPVRGAFGAQVTYALWALPVLRLLLPPLPAHWHASVANPIADMGEQITILVLPDHAPAVATQAASMAPAGPSFVLLFGMAWGAGAALFLGWHLLSYRRFCRRVMRDARPIATLDGITVVATDAATGPLAFGVARRFVAFPPDFAERYDREERALALAHEMGHHQRGDLIANWVALGVLALHWFNPVAWAAYRAYRTDQEMANDARVLAGCGLAERHAYACAIVKSAHGGAIAAACHLHTIDDLKGRLKMLGLHKVSRGRLMAGGAAVVAMTLAGLGLTASGTQAAEVVRETITRTTGTDVTTTVTQDAPVAPAAADAPPAPDKPVARHHRVVVVKDGKTQSYEGAEADAFVAAHPEAMVVAPLPPAPPLPARAAHVAVPPVPPVPPIAIEVPQVISRDCGAREGGGERQVVLNRRNGKEQMIVICNNRIAKLAAMSTRMAQVDSVAIRRNAMQSALAGLQSARAGMVANTGMTEEARREAIASMDESIAELRSEMNDPD